MEDLIRTYFSKKPEVIAGYLYGSQATGKQQIDSNIDIGILLRQKDLKKEDELREQVIVELSRILKKDIHPVIMNTAGEELLRQIFSKGKCVQTNDSKLLSQFVLVSLCRIAEFGYYRKMIQKGFLRSVGEAFHGRSRFDDCQSSTGKETRQPNPE